MDSPVDGTSDASVASVHQLPGYIPRRMRANVAARYMGVSESTFQSRVKAGVYPPGKKEIGTKFWLRDDLDSYIDRQFGLVPSDDVEANQKDPFLARFRRAG